MSMHNIEVRRCDRCGARGEAEIKTDRREGHPSEFVGWGRLRADEIGGTRVISGPNSGGTSADLCGECFEDLCAWFKRIGRYAPIRIEEPRK